MKVLFYGGCHANALCNIFRRYTSKNNEYDFLNNFRLIQSGAPFPWDFVKRFEAVVFSPVSNPEYSTSELIGFCCENAIQAISYPWIQWNGYFPFAEKSAFLGGKAWNYVNLFDARESASDFSAFYDAVSEEDYATEAVLANVDSSTRRLEDFETEFGTDLIISDFIRQNYKAKRLFLTPDHASRHLYKYVARMIAERLNMTLDRSLFLSGNEPQAGIKIPILPSVSKQLELQFQDGDFQNKPAFKGATFGWKEYLSFYETRIACAYVATADTFEGNIPVKRGYIILCAEALGSASEAIASRVLVSGGEFVDREALIDPTQWRQVAPGLS